jgi:hypothetical protein
MASLNNSQAFLEYILAFSSRVPLPSLLDRVIKTCGTLIEPTSQLRFGEGIVGHSARVGAAQDLLALNIFMASEEGAAQLSSPEFFAWTASDASPRIRLQVSQRQFSEMNNDLLNRIHIDLQFQASTQLQPLCAVFDGAAETERLYGGRCCEATGSRTVRGDGTSFAGRFADGASVMALSPAKKGSCKLRTCSRLLTYDGSVAAAL